MKKLKVSLLAKVVIAIAAGVVFGQFLPGGIARIFVTFNSLFGNFLSFSIPLIILGLVTPAIGELGKGAGTDRIWLNYLLWFLHLFQQFGNLPTYPTGQHGVNSNGKSRRLHVATLFYSRHATFDGCHDSFASILHHRAWLVLY